jgi:hypothetical protein
VEAIRRRHPDAYTHGGSSHKIQRCSLQVCSVLSVPGAVENRLPTRGCKTNHARGLETQRNRNTELFNDFIYIYSIWEESLFEMLNKITAHVFRADLF